MISQAKEVCSRKTNWNSQFVQHGSWKFSCAFSISSIAATNFKKPPDHISLDHSIVCCFKEKKKMQHTVQNAVGCSWAMSRNSLRN